MITRKQRLATRVMAANRRFHKEGKRMNPDSACKLINESLFYRPGWTFEAVKHTQRFENAIRVRIEFDTVDTSEPTADNTYETPFRLHVSFTLMVGRMDDVGLYKALLGVILRVEEHEAREFLKVKPTQWAPFHPHTEDGIKRWHETAMLPDYAIADLQYGL